MLSTLTLLLATTASLTTASCPSPSPPAGECHPSTTTLLNPTCTPWTGICPLILCATPTATATAVVPAVTSNCAPEDGVVPVVTRYRGCTTDCGPVTCPTLTVTRTTMEGVGCCEG